jgi:hypothetical protein
MKQATLSEPRDDSESGAVTVLTALFAVILLIMVALVADVGLIYAEKAQLQNAADSAALAVAGECSTDVAHCTVADRQPTANALANENSNDNSSKVGLTISGGVVTATTSTTSGGGNSLSLPFGSWTGLSSTTVEAVAQATWGGINSGTPTLPITFGACELDPVNHPMDGVDRVLIAHGSLTNDGKCSAWNTSAGLNMPGGFGWLKTGSNCTPTITVDNPWVESSPGASTPSGCAGIINTSSVGKTFLVPIYGYANGTGASGGYKIVGWGVFVLKGWNLPANNPTNTFNWPASNSVKGLFGHFIKMLSYEDGFTYDGPPEYGATGAKLIK